MGKANISPIGIVSYPRLAQPEEFNGVSKYSITLLFDKTDPALATMKAAAQEAVKKKFGDKVPPNMKSPFKDGDYKNKDGDQPAYAGKTYVVFRTKNPPGIRDASNTVNINANDSEGIYAGCKARVAYDCFAYDQKGNQGVSFGFSGVQKIEDGPRLDSHVSAENAFEAVAGAVAPQTSDASIF